MFPCAALFTAIDCPFRPLGLCVRPYCLYKHTKEDRSCLSVCSVAAGTGHGHHGATRRAFHKQEQSCTCLSELERIKKQIEAVRSEVEKEQKRLSQYQSEQVEVTSTSTDAYFKGRSTVPKNQNENRPKSKTMAAATSASRPSACKYVVDRTKPRTDLEYDPCSNFSSDLRSGNSKEKMKLSNKTDLVCHPRIKGMSKSMCADAGQLPSCSFQDSDDDVLIIDVPPLEKRHSRPQKQSIQIPEDLVCIKNEMEHQRLLKKCADVNMREFQEVPALENEMLTLTKAATASINKQLDSPERNFVIDIPHQQNDTGKPRHFTLQRVKVTSEGVNCLGNGPPEVEQRSSVQCMILRESTKRMDISEVENDLKSLKQISNGNKSGKVKEISMCQLTVRENLCETAGPSLIANILESESADSASPGKRAHITENVLDDISLCLKHLRSESENLACPPDVEKCVPVNTSPALSCSTKMQDLFPQSAKIGGQKVNVGRTGLEVPKNCLSSSAQKVETFSLKCPPQAQQEMVFQDYFPTTFPALIKEPGTGQNIVTSTETCWHPTQKVSAEPAVQNMPVYISGADTVGVPSAQSKLHNLATTSIDLTPGQVHQKPPSSVTSGTAYRLRCPSQISSPGGRTAADNEVIEILSSSSEELNYSDLDLSETDPMEECYKIFMEANGSESFQARSDETDEVPKLPEAEESVKPPPAQKKRVAHVAKFEQVSKSKAQVIVPLRDGGPQLPVPTRSQQCQKRATALTAAVKGCHSYVVANAPKRVLTTAVIPPSPVPGVGTTLRLGSNLHLGPNLHLIVPEGNCALPITLIPAAVPVTRPLHQPAQNLQPVQPPNYTPAKSIPTKRKAKARADVGVKVPHDVRQRYVNLFVEEFLKTSATVQDAFEKALAEEKTVFDRSINKLKYQSVAVNVLKRLKNQNAAPVKLSSERDAQASRGNVPLNTRALLGNGDVALYDQLKEHVLTEAMLRENNYPCKHPTKAGFAIQYGDTKKGSSDAFRRICCRCGTTYSVNQVGKHTRKEECNYHYGKVIENRVPGGVETRYTCCENAVGAPGCQVFKLHIHDEVSLQGFMSSPPQTTSGCPGIYAIDTVMCYTTRGLELARVTVVSSSLQVIYDTFVKPNNEVIDYDTRFSGVSEDDVKSSSSSLRDVQAALLSFISADTILVGHGLETDLCALKLLHSTVVDTSVVFPHRLGPPHKRELNSLTAEHLRRIIQESVQGHDSREDAVAAMELMLWKVKEDTKGKRW